MEFEQIEKRLKGFFKTYTAIPSQEIRKRIKTATVQDFKNRYTQTSPRISWWTMSLRFSKVALVSGLAIVVFNVVSLTKTELLAGQINPKSGTVTITRGNEILLIEKSTSLREGDIIHVENESEAEILFPDEFKSIIKPQTQLKLINRNELFIERGQIINTSFESHQLSGNRGFVEGLPGSEFTISISESGEMEIISQKNQINVFDWNSGETSLASGQKINLRTDTALTNREIPKNLNLSSRQIQSIQAKLTITRTKLISTLEKILIQNQLGQVPKTDLLSVQASFLSLLDILHASRDMTIAYRTHWESFTFEDVILEMRERNVPEMYIEEARALQTLFFIVQEKGTDITISTQKSQIESFNRFAIMHDIFQGNNQAHADILKQKYVGVFLQQILNEELRIDQVSRLNQEISKLPKNEYAKDFLTRLQKALPPDVASILEEKIQKDFY